MVYACIGHYIVRIVYTCTYTCMRMPQVKTRTAPKICSHCGSIACKYSYLCAYTHIRQTHAQRARTEQSTKESEWNAHLASTTMQFSHVSPSRMSRSFDNNSSGVDIISRQTPERERGGAYTAESLTLTRERDDGFTTSALAKGDSVRDLSSFRHEGADTLRQRDAVIDRDDFRDKGRRILEGRKRDSVSMDIVTAATDDAFVAGSSRPERRAIDVYGDRDVYKEKSAQSSSESRIQKRDSYSESMDTRTVWEEYGSKVRDMHSKDRETLLKDRDMHTEQASKRSPEGAHGGVSDNKPASVDRRWYAEQEALWPRGDENNGVTNKYVQNSGGYSNSSDLRTSGSNNHNNNNSNLSATDSYINNSDLRSVTQNRNATSNASILTPPNMSITERDVFASHENTSLGDESRDGPTKHYENTSTGHDSRSNGSILTSSVNNDSSASTGKAQTQRPSSPQSYDTFKLKEALLDLETEKDKVKILQAEVSREKDARKQACKERDEASSLNETLQADLLREKDAREQAIKERDEALARNHTLETELELEKDALMQAIKERDEASTLNQTLQMDLSREKEALNQTTSERDEAYFANETFQNKNEGLEHSISNVTKENER
jgi:hypothetical protein